MTDRRPALLLPFCLAVALHLVGAVCVTHLAGRSLGAVPTPAPENRLQLRLRTARPVPAPAPAPVRVTPPPAAAVVEAAEPPEAPAPEDAPAPVQQPLAPPTVAVVSPEPVLPRAASRAPAPAPAVRETRPSAAVETVLEPPAEASRDAESGAVAPLQPSAAPVAETPDWAIDGQIAPRYPLLSRLRGEEGRVVLRVSLDAAGRPIDSVIESGSGHGALDRAALNAVRRATWSVRPGVSLPDAETNAIVRVPIDFRLEPVAPFPEPPPLAPDTPR